MTEVEMECPTSLWPHMTLVLEGSYDVPGLVFEKPPRILDIGACVGAFSIWAASRWPDAMISAYEPNPEAFKLLERNLSRNGVTNASVFRAGVGNHPEVRLLYAGKNNIGEASVHLRKNNVETDSFQAEFIAAAALPPCDILKVDTEGCEVEILQNYPHLRDVTALLVEWHNREDRQEIEYLAELHDLILCGGHTIHADLGECIYVREDKLP